MKTRLGDTHFYLEETTRSDLAHPDHIIKPDPIQFEMHCALAVLAEVLFRKPLNSPVYVTSGQRDRIIFSLMMKAGYHPSPTSDHFFGAEIEDWRWSTGALDLHFGKRESDTLNIYRDAHKFLQKHPEYKRQIGQMIYYPRDEINKRDAFVHLSLSWEMVYGPVVIGALQNLKHGKRKFLQKTPSGYTPFVI